MPPASSIARLREGGRTWALGALSGDDEALETLALRLLDRWQPGERLVVLGNMSGPAGDSARTIDHLLVLRRRLLARRGAEVEDFVFLRGAHEEMWHKLLQLQFAMTPLDVLDWMLARGLAATIESYGHSIAEGRIAARNGPSAIVRWTTGLRRRQAARPGHTDLLGSVVRAAVSADGRVVFSAAGIDPARPLEEQADTFWWCAQTDSGLAGGLAQAGDAGWADVAAIVRGAGPKANVQAEGHRVITVTGERPALVALDATGRVVDRISA